MGGREQGIPGRLLPASLPYPAVSNKNKKRSCLRQSERGRSNIQGDPLTAGVGLAHTCTHTSTYTHTHLCSKSLLLTLVLLARIPPEGCPSLRMATSCPSTLSYSLDMIRCTHTLFCFCDLTWCLPGCAYSVTYLPRLCISAYLPFIKYLLDHWGNLKKAIAKKTRYYSVEQRRESLAVITEKKGQKV